MDDMKREIYLEILKELEKPNKDVFICNELRFALVNLYKIEHYDFIVSEFFPEFAELFDGYNYGTKGRWKVNTNNSWFSHRNKKARITLINFLLSNR